jgi:CheY-like chemotaxis protein
LCALSNSSKDPLALQSDINPHSKNVSLKKKIQSKFEGGVNGDHKQVLIIDDNYDSAFTIKSCLESHFRQNTEGLECQPIRVTVYVNPVLALKEFKTYYYDLLLVDINMPSINGYELVEKIIKLDFNIKICFMSAGEINYEAIREIRHPSKSFGCFIKKPASSTDLVNRVLQELY